MTGLRVTDHALVRWLERTGAADVDALKAILAGSLARASAAAEQVNAGHYLILADGLVYVVKEGLLITVLEDDGRSHVRALSPEPDRN
jgi:hypothetical protein